MERERVKHGIEGYVDRFLTAIRSTGGPAFDRRPSVKIETTPQLSFSEQQGITLPLWEDLPPPMQQIFDAIAGVSRLMTARQFFEELFNWFIVPHELTHWYEGAVL